MKIVGIDLAGKESNETGFCVLEINRSELAKKIPKISTTTKTLFYDREIIDEVEKANPDLVCVDAPLNFPEEGYLRRSDKLLKEEGFKPLSPLFPGMKPLTRRGRMLAKILRGKKFKVLEVFSKASEKILGLDKTKAANEHEYEALACALTGKAYLQDRYRDLDGLIIPK